MAKLRYFQINRAAHPEKDTLADAWKKTDEQDRTAINRIEVELPAIAKQRYNDKLSGLGHIGLTELLCKLALFKLSHDGDHPQKGALARMDVVLEAIERLDD